VLDAVEGILFAKHRCSKITRRRSGEDPNIADINIIAGLELSGMAYPTTTPTEISEAIRVLDESHKKQILDLRLKMDALQKEYLRERQELSSKLLQAIRLHEVPSDPATLSLPGLPQHNTTPVPTAQDLFPTSMSNVLDSSLTSSQFSSCETVASSTAAVTSSNVIISTAGGQQYMVPALPRQYIQVQLNPDGSQVQQVVQVVPTLTTTTTTSATPTSGTPGTSA
jgi:hypothetical protein